MGVFTFVCKGSGDEWSAKQFKGDLEASASCTYDLQRKLVQAALASDSSDGVQSSFSYITPSSAVFQGSVMIQLKACFSKHSQWPPKIFRLRQA